MRAWQFPLLYIADPQVHDSRHARRGLRHCELPVVLEARFPVLLRIGWLPPNPNLFLLLYLPEGVMLISGTLNDNFR
jgi:hypothetical protein